MNRVLYIEDNLSNIKLVQNVLVHLKDIEFIASQKSLDGIEIINNEQVDLILLDINIPVLNGYEVLKKIRSLKNKANIPVIALTANAMKQDIENLKTAGFDHFLIKPFDIQELMHCVEEQLNKPLTTH